MLVREFVFTMSALSMPAAVAVVVGGAAAPFLAVESDGASELRADSPKAREARLAFEIHCAACHGLEAEGTAAAPALSGPSAGYYRLADGALMDHVLARHGVWSYRGGLRPARGTPDPLALSRALAWLRALAAAEG